MQAIAGPEVVLKAIHIDSELAFFKEEDDFALIAARGFTADICACGLHHAPDSHGAEVSLSGERLQARTGGALRLDSLALSYAGRDVLSLSLVK